MITGCCSCNNSIIIELEDHRDYRDCKYICSECSSKSTATTINEGCDNEYVGEIVNSSKDTVTSIVPQTIVMSEAVALYKLKELVCELN